MKRVTVYLLILVSCSIVIAQDTVFVAVDGNNLSWDGTESLPWQTIEYALSQITPSAENHVVLKVLAGHYSPSTNGEEFPIQLKSNVTLTGDGINQSILDAEGTDRVILCDSLSNITIEHLSVRNGYVNTESGQSGLFGGGISIESCSKVLFQFNEVDNNAIVNGLGGSAYGGGIGCTSGTNVTIFSNVITNNSSGGDGSSGGGCYLHGSMVFVANNTISHNYNATMLGSRGSGIHLNAWPGLLVNNTIMNNSRDYSYFGVGVLISRKALIVRNHITENNSHTTTNSRAGNGIGIQDYSEQVVIGGSPGNGNNIYDNHIESNAWGKQLALRGEEIYVIATHNYFGEGVDPSTDSTIVYPLANFLTDHFSSETITFSTNPLISFFDTVRFTSSNLGESLEIQGEVYNTSNSVVNILHTDIADPSFTASLDSQVVQPFSSAIFNISFTPEQYGLTEASLFIHLEDDTLELPLRGHVEYPVSAVQNSIHPNSFIISNIYPNPFNPSTTIEYELPEHSEISLIIYDIAGREVQMLVSTSHEAGSYSSTWNGTDENGRQVSGGMYFARLQAGEYSSVVKMVYLK